MMTPKIWQREADATRLLRFMLLWKYPVIKGLIPKIDLSGRRASIISIFRILEVLLPFYCGFGCGVKCRISWVSSVKQDWAHALELFPRQTYMERCFLLSLSDWSEQRIGPSAIFVFRSINDHANRSRKTVFIVFCANQKTVRGAIFNGCRARNKTAVSWLGAPSDSLLRCPVVFKVWCRIYQIYASPFAMECLLFMNILLLQ